MPYKIRLKITRGESDIQYFELIDLSKSISVDGYKTDYKVTQGNRQQGIEQGIGIVKAGRKLTFAIPIFENKGKNVYDLISEYTSILLNSFSYEFFIEHFYKNTWYSAKCQIIETGNYSVKLTNYLNGFKIKLQMIDNYFLGSEVKENIGLEGSGVQTIEYESKSLVPTSFGFEWTIQGIDNTLSAYLVHNNNYGLVISRRIGAGSYTLYYDGESILLKDNNSEDENNSILLPFEGVRPFLNVGKNELTISNSFNTSEFNIIYREGIAI